MINLLYGPEPRSTRHSTFVRRVRKYLEKKCGRAGSEEQVVHGHITDAFGFNKKSKTAYLCEVKVRRSDLRRAPNQIYETALRFRKDHRIYTTVPVIAIPVKLYRFLVDKDNWEPLYSMCGNLGIALWVIEQSAIREILSPKIDKAVKTKGSRASTTKKKATRAKNTVSKKRVVKKGKTRKTKTTKKKTTRSKSTSVKKRVARTSRAKTLKTQSIKRKASGVKASQPKPTKKKHKSSE